MGTTHLEIKGSRPSDRLGAWLKQRTRTGLALVFAALVVACGAGKENDDGQQQQPANSGPAPTRNEAARFLAQASYGPTDASINALTRTSLAAWIEAQFNMPALPHRNFVDRRTVELAAAMSSVSQTQFRESYWAQALTRDDQLRQRAAFALSQVFVISFNDGTLANQPRGVTSYYDMLAEKAFGNYRDLLESVTLHPMMGIYLTHMRNQKEDLASGRVPDENYAREVMQLFSIGLYELNSNGTPSGGSTPTETYTHADIQGLAKVLTGFSWYAGPNLADRTNRRFFGNDAHADRDWQPMQAYNTYHSTSEKRFLGRTIAANSSPNADADLRIALDTLFNHPNVGPFIGKQLIQRLVTSNPSPAYVGRVAAAFNDNGRGVRGDMKAVWRAILLDSEARSPNLASASYGKVREPILRLSHFLRAFKATSTSGNFTGIDNTDDPSSRLSQTAMRSPSVFNFYRPGFTPPNSAAADAGLVSPELQLANEVSVAGYLNYMRSTWLNAGTGRDIQLDFSAEQAIADNATALVDRLNLLLMSGQMSTAHRDQVIAAVNSRSIPTTNQTNIDSAKRDRVYIGILLTMASPDYLVQK